MNSFFYDRYGKSKIPLAKSRLFWFGVAIKLGFAVFFASPFLKELFAPFGNYFIGSGFSDPYQYFSDSGTGAEFPYPPLMLWIFSLPRTILWPLFPGSHEVFTIADSLIYRLPLLMADFVILVVLIRWLKTSARQVLIWYWLSPVLIYINYFHGQLDAIPISLLFVSLYFLFRNKSQLAFLFLAFAIACKTNMALVLPFYVIYILRTSEMGIWRPLKAMLILLGTIFVLNLPYINSEGFQSMVYDNPVQQHVFDLFYQFNSSLKIYFIPSVYFVLVLYYMSFRFVNRDQLILFLAFTFLALTLMIAPMQGWYFWIVPFLSYFVIKQGTREKYVFAILSILYFLYFGLIPASDYFRSFNLADTLTGSFDSQNHDKLLSIVFTLLQTTLVLIGVLVFRKGIANNIQAKFLSQPYMIGIGGDSAAGKSTLTNALAQVFEPQNTSIIRGDDMHKWERGDENWSQYTHLDPRANNLHQEMAQALSLKTGKGIRRSFYDHSTGKFTLPKFIKPNKLIIFEGLHSFYLQNHKNIYDLKIFMEPDENLRLWWKVKRDVAKRGYEAGQVLEQIKKREEDSVRYIRSQAEQADIIASFFSTNQTDPLVQDVEPQIALRLVLQNNFYIDPVIERLGGLEIKHAYENDKQELVLKGHIDKETIGNIAYRLIPELEEVGVYNSGWKDDYEGLLQLITAYIVFNKLKDLDN
jgi:uridine kinase